ncbi:MarR family winged helix-turn-helix transcriptional regulator [Jongsikchunia kroppenstedtii]|uniref:MarR family winged helix-turn-helix transcriptional regulator n=1 Tax=Jongsikchunia kroppenstedtii TaxID=1121721 RepID=UPI00036ACC59|nr:MarR family transcriptional regulator [Jongsikchunia kroppenstedtii]
MSSTTARSTSAPTSGSPSIADVADAIHDFVSRLVNDANSNSVDHSFMNSDLGFSHFKSLLVLRAKGTLSVNELAESLSLSVAATGRAVDKLVQLGLVDRREDTADRRVKRVSLTGEAEKELASWMGAKEDRVRDFVGSLPDPLRDRFFNVLTEVINGDYLGPADPAMTAIRSTPNTATPKGTP